MSIKKIVCWLLGHMWVDCKPTVFLKRRKCLSCEQEQIIRCEDWIDAKPRNDEES